MPGWEGRGLAIVTNARTNRKAYRRLPAQLEPARPRPCCETLGVTRRLRQAQQAPHTGLHFHFYEYFLNSWGAVSARYYVLESKVLLKSLQVCLEKAGEKADVT